MAADTFCSTWTSSSRSLIGNGNVTVTVVNNGTADTLTVGARDCAGLAVGTLSLNRDYVTANVEFRGNGSNDSTITLNSAGDEITVKLGSGNGQQSNVQAASPQLHACSDLEGRRRQPRQHGIGQWSQHQPVLT
jgi:hypothetical protein